VDRHWGLGPKYWKIGGATEGSYYYLIYRSYPILEFFVEPICQAPVIKAEHAGVIYY